LNNSLAQQIMSVKREALAPPSQFFGSSSTHPSKVAWAPNSTALCFNTFVLLSKLQHVHLWSGFISGLQVRHKE